MNMGFRVSGERIPHDIGRLEPASKLNSKTHLVLEMNCVCHLRPDISNGRLGHSCMEGTALTMSLLAPPASAVVAY